MIGFTSVIKMFVSKNKRTKVEFILKTQHIRHEIIMKLFESLQK